MCGIVGVATKWDNGFLSSDIDYFQQALVFDSVRGIDGTGIVQVKSNGHFQWAKVASHPFRLLHNEKVRAMLSQSLSNGKVLIGHNRKATSGKIVNENAHPFVKDHIAMVHNGYVKDAKQLVDTEVDSEVIAHILAEEADIPAALAKLEGAFAVVWYNQKLKHLYMVRNKERPLYYSMTEQMLHFASEPWIISVAQQRSYHENFVNHFPAPKVVPVNTVLALDLKSFKIEEISADFKSWETEQAKKQLPATPSGVGPASTSRGAIEIPTLLQSTHGSGTTSGISTLAPHQGRYTVGQPIKCKFVSLENRRSSPAEHPRVLLTGYTDDASKVEVKHWFPFGTDQAVIDSFIGAEYFHCRVRHCVLKGQYISLIWVQEPKPAVKLLPKPSPSGGDLVKTYNGQSLLQVEWKSVCNTFKCTTCNKALNARYPKYTSVQITGKQKPRIICPECIVSRFPNFSATAQAEIIKSNGYSPMDYLLEKEGEMC